MKIDWHGGGRRDRNGSEGGGVANLVSALTLGTSYGVTSILTTTGARPGATNPITGLNHPAGKKRRRSLADLEAGFIRAGAEPMEERALGTSFQAGSRDRPDREFSWGCCI